MCFQQMQGWRRICDCMAEDSSIGSCMTEDSSIGSCMAEDSNICGCRTADGKCPGKYAEKCITEIWRSRGGSEFSDPSACSGR